MKHCFTTVLYKKISKLNEDLTNQSPHHYIQSYFLIVLTVPSIDANLTHFSKSVVHFSLIPALIWNGPLFFIYLHFMTGQEFCSPPPVCLRSSDLRLEPSDYRLLSVSSKLISFMKPLDAYTHTPLTFPVALMLCVIPALNHFFRCSLWGR